MGKAGGLRATLKKKQESGDVFALACPSRGVLEHVTSRWAVLVLVTLTEGVHRFSELRRAVTGVSEKMLAQTLSTLEADGFVTRTAYPEVPPRVEYALTPLGVQVAGQVEGLVDWISENLPEVLAAREAQVKAKTKVASR